MKKRGQLYLIAALFIVLIFGGLNYLYVHAKPQSSKRSTIYTLADEIHFEANRLIDNRVNAKIPDSEIAQILRTNLTLYYALRHPEISFILVYGNTNATYIINSTTGTLTDPSSTSNKVVVNMLGIQKELQIIEGRQNLYVIMGTERSGEKFIVLR